MTLSSAQALYYLLRYKLSKCESSFYELKYLIGRYTIIRCYQRVILKFNLHYFEVKS